MRRRAAAAAPCLVAFALAASPNPAEATVIVSAPDDPLPFLNLFRPTGEFDETGLSGFEFLISSTTDPFTGNDQYLISGNETEPTTSIGNNLGDVADISAVEFFFSIQHNLVGGRNFTFSLTEQGSGTTDTLCWGQNCAPASNAVPILNGIPPIIDYNGIQLQVRAQEVVGSSATVEILSLNGVTVSGAGFFNESVTPSSPGTIPSDTGRRGQWMLADDLDLTDNEWELTGLVTLVRPDAALTDRTKVRLAVDLVRDPSLPYVMPEPASPLLLGAALLALRVLSGRRRERLSNRGPSGKRAGVAEA